jgi:hypothetical protein
VEFNMPTEKPIELELEVSVHDSTPEDLDTITRSLLKELRETDVESIRLVSVGIAPKGSKAGDTVTAGMLAMAVLPTVLPSVISLIKDWIMRGKGRTVKFKGKGIEFEGTAEDLEKLLEKLERGKGKK